MRRFGNALLRTEPLTAEDWAEVHVLYRGFQDAVRAIVMHARARRRLGVLQSAQGQLDDAGDWQ